MREILSSEAGRRALAARDINAVIGLLGKVGVTQRELAFKWSMSQSEISEIRKGRKVMQYDLLVRIADALDVPHGWMGLAYDEKVPTVAEPFTIGDTEEDEDMKRRLLLATGSALLLGVSVTGDAPVRWQLTQCKTPLPQVIRESDVAAVRCATDHVRQIARTTGGTAELAVGMANRGLKLLTVKTTTEGVRRELLSAVAELHTMAGWCCVDSGIANNARACFAIAMDLAGQSGDPRQIADAFRHAGMQMVDVRQDLTAVNQGLKMYQLGMAGISADTDRAWLVAESAIPLAQMGEPTAAVRALNSGRDTLVGDDFDHADMDYVHAITYYRMGLLDPAETMASSARQRLLRLGSCQRGTAGTDVLLALIHVQAGDSGAGRYAQRAIKGVSGVASVRACNALAELAAEMRKKGGSELTSLAEVASRVSSPWVG